MVLNRLCMDEQTGLRHCCSHVTNLGCPTTSAVVNLTVLQAVIAKRENPALIFTTHRSPPLVYARAYLNFLGSGFDSAIRPGSTQSISISSEMNKHGWLDNSNSEHSK